MSQPQKRKQNRTTLVLLLVCFSAPFLFAHSLYKRSEQMTFNTSHHGQLIAPALLATALSYDDLQGHTLPASDLLGRWWMIYLAPEDCAERCQARLHDLEQIQLALGKNSRRAARLMLTESGSASPSTAPEKAWNYAALNKADLLYYYMAYVSNPQKHRSAGSVFIQDPLGHLMMVYSDDVEASGILKDLKRLLHNSQIG